MCVFSCIGRDNCFEKDAVTVTEVEVTIGKLKSGRSAAKDEVREKG